MRYRDGQLPDPDAPFGASTQDMLTLSVLIAIVIGVCLFLAGRHGNVMWLKVWSVGLLLCSGLYFGAEAIGLV